MTKQIKILFIIWLLLETMHVGVNESNIKLDIFILLDYPGPGRYLTNIFYDFSVHFYWLASTFILWRLFRYFKFANHQDVLLTQLSRLSGYLKMVFIWRCLEFILYLLICNQSSNLISLPILLILLLYENKQTN